MCPQEGAYHDSDGWGRKRERDRRRRRRRRRERERERGGGLRGGVQKPLLAISTHISLKCILIKLQAAGLRDAACARTNVKIFTQKTQFARALAWKHGG